MCDGNLHRIRIFIHFHECKFSIYQTDAGCKSACRIMHTTIEHRKIESINQCLQESIELLSIQICSAFRLAKTRQPNRTNAITVHNKHSFNYILLIKKKFFLSDLKIEKIKRNFILQKPKHNCNFNSYLLRISLSMLNKGRSTSKSTQILLHIEIIKKCGLHIRAPNMMPSIDRKLNDLCFEVYSFGQKND